MIDGDIVSSDDHKDQTRPPKIDGLWKRLFERGRSALHQTSLGPIPGLRLISDI